VSTAGFAVGGVGLAVGVILLATLPSDGDDSEDDGGDDGGDDGVDEARLQLVPWLDAHEQGSAGLLLRGTW
jgi:hypothetical protein